jgi:MFS family permease
MAAFRAALVVSLTTGFVFFGLRISLVPLFVTESLQRGVGLVGAGFVVATAVQAAALVPAGRRTDSVGRRPSLLLGAAALIASMLLLVLDTGWIGLLVAMAASGLAAAFLGAPAAAVVGDVTRGQSGGRVVSAYQMVGDLGGILGPLAAGALADALGFHWAFGTGLAVALLTLAMVLAMPETLRRPAQAAEAGAAPSP